MKIENPHSGLRGTFYLNVPLKNPLKQLEPWVDVAARGHEIGGHGIKHHCSSNFFGNPGGLEELTLETVETDIVQGKTFLQRIFPHQADWTFAYPCYCTGVGRGRFWRWPRKSHNTSKLCAELFLHE